MKTIITIITILTISNTTPTAVDTSVIVDRVEGNYAVVEVYCDGEIKMIDICQDDFNTAKVEKEKIKHSVVSGKFTCDFEDVDGNKYYQFKSNDNTVWWALTENEIGFIPTENLQYSLMYYDNGTTDCFECPEIYNCECEVYDDIFLGVF